MYSRELETGAKKRGEREVNKQAEEGGGRGASNQATRGFA